MADDWRRRQQMAGGLLGGLSAAQLAAMGKHVATGQGKSWLPNWLYSRVHPGVKTGFRPWMASGPTRGVTNPLVLGLLSMAYSKPAGAGSDIPDTSFGPVEGIKVIKKKKKKNKVGPH